MKRTKKISLMMLVLIALGKLAYGMHEEHKQNDCNNNSDYTQINSHDDSNDTGVIDIDTDNLSRDANVHTPNLWDRLPSDIAQEVLRYLFALQGDSPHQMDEHYNNAYWQIPCLKFVSKNFTAILKKDYIKKVKALAQIWGTFRYFETSKYQWHTAEAFVATFNAPILQLHADSQDRDRRITTPLHVAALMGHEHFFKIVHNRCIEITCQRLLKQGKVPNPATIAVQLLHQEDRFRNKPIHYARYGEGKNRYDRKDRYDRHVISDYIKAVPGYLSPEISQATRGAISTFDPNDQFALSTLTTALAPADNNNNQPGLFQDLTLHYVLRSYRTAPAQSIISYIQSQPSSEAWGAYLCSVDHDGNTALHLAVLNCYNPLNPRRFINYYECTEKLLAVAKDHGVLAELLTCKNNAGQTVLHTAIYNRHHSFVTMLLTAAKDHGALTTLLMSKDNSSNTVLHALYLKYNYNDFDADTVTQTASHYKILKKLLTAAKDHGVLATLLTSKNNNGMTVLPMVLQLCHNAMLARLYAVAYQFDLSNVNSWPTAEYGMPTMRFTVTGNNTMFTQQLVAAAHEQKIRTALLNNNNDDLMAALLSHDNSNHLMLTELLITARDHGILTNLLESKDIYEVTALDHAKFNNKMVIDMLAIAQAIDAEEELNSRTICQRVRDYSCGIQ